jgi:hypothetical protein
MRTLLLASLLAAVPALAETKTGLIAYDACVADGKVTEADHAKCAEGKDRDDYILVFVDQGNPKKVFELFFEDPADPFVGKWVKIEAEVDDNFLDIQSIEAAPEPARKK